MSSSRWLPLLALVCLLAAPALAQCGGNGGQGSLESDPMALGTTVTVAVSGGAGQGFGLYLSDGPGPLAVPGFGTICLDLLSPVFGILLQGTLPPSGSQPLSFFVPNDPTFLSALLFLQALVADPTQASGLALTNALRVQFHLPDTFAPLPSLTTARALATASRTADGRVLVAGGGAGSVLAPLGTNTTDLFEPVLHTVVPGPLLVSSRALHTATELPDGRVLLVGGVVDALGTVTSGAEIVDISAGVSLPAAAMGTPRAGHVAALLPDGRVLVAGGTTTFAGTLGTVLNASLNTGEIYDPSLNSWSPAGNSMGAKRFGAAMVRLNDGRALAIGGLIGSISFLGQDIPQFTASCDHFSHLTNLFSAGPSLGSGQARAFHGATTLPDGRVWVTGGALGGLLPTVTSSTRILAGGSWVAGPGLPQAVALPTQTRLRNGAIHLWGGVNGNLATQTFGAVADCVRYDGTTLAPRAAFPSARGSHVALLLADGKVFLAGGADATGSAVGSSLLYTPDP